MASICPEQRVTAAEAVAGEYEHLEHACRCAMLAPHAVAARPDLCRLLQTDRSASVRPGSLAHGLAEEALAHGDALAFRMEQAVPWLSAPEQPAYARPWLVCGSSFSNLPRGRPRADAAGSQ